MGGAYLGQGIPTLAGVPTMAWGGTYLGQVGYLPWPGSTRLGWEYLLVPTLAGGGGYPPWLACEQTENITFPHPSDAGGNHDVTSQLVTLRFPVILARQLF